MAERKTTPTISLPDERVLDVSGISVQFATSERVVTAVRDLSFHVDRGETLAIVGESGSGKSVTSLAAMRLVENGGGRITQGSMIMRRRNGKLVDLTRASGHTMRSIRGADMAMIFQEPMTSLNPVFPVGEQIAESIRLHQARLLMMRRGMTAAAAASAVGYESASQFSREFKRLFGLPPLTEMQRMKNSFALPAQPDGDYVSSH